MMNGRSKPREKVTAAALLTTASLIALLCGMPEAAAADCASATPPADLATPTTLFEMLHARSSAQLLAMNFLQRPVEQECAWIYEVKVVTASGSVVELDFAARGLDLIGARGPQNDRDAAALVQRFGGDAGFLDAGRNSSGSGSAANSGTGSGGSGESGDGDDGSGSGGSGEGGNSGSGSGSSGGGGSGGGSGSGSGGEGGGDDGGGGEGGEGSEGGGDD
jgi:hypothetical protein